MTVAVRAHELAKQYRLGANVTGRLTESMSATARRALGRPSASRHQSIWALKGVSFEVEQGEVVGFIGRNGAGKSTLLKILSRITEPTSGRAELRGRVGSLLEVGSGFHPDLTGRENVFLYGAILGMSRREVRTKFDEIVEFSEIEQFIDTPVKRYSSGMHMRLAFAVAAHLEPEILLVDEVLAVGDAGFQRKSLGKMEDVASEGRTVFFVSHNTGAVSSLCDRAYLLEGGRITATGDAREVVDAYIASTQERLTTPVSERADRGGDGSARIVSLRIEDADGRPGISTSSRLRISLAYESAAPLPLPKVSATLYARNYIGLVLLDSDATGGLPDVLPPRGTVTCVTEPIQISPGECFVNIGVFRRGVLADHLEYAAPVTVEADDFYASGRLPPLSRVVSVRRHEWFASAA